MLTNAFGYSILEPVNKRYPQVFYAACTFRIWLFNPPPHIWWLHMERKIGNSWFAAEIFVAANINGGELHVKSILSSQFWHNLLAHPSYDSDPLFETNTPCQNWRLQAVHVQSILQYGHLSWVHSTDYSSFDFGVKKFAKTPTQRNILSSICITKFFCPKSGAWTLPSQAFWKDHWHFGI